LYVVVWELKHGRGGGHQLALNMPKAEQIRWRLSRERPDAMIRVEPAKTTLRPPSRSARNSGSDQDKPVRGVPDLLAAKDDGDVGR
jgi:hypothetical protein